MRDYTQERRFWANVFIGRLAAIVGLILVFLGPIAIILLGLAMVLFMPLTLALFFLVVLWEASKKLRATLAILCQGI